MKIDPSTTAGRQAAAQMQKELILRDQAELAQMQKFHQAKKQELQLAHEQELTKLRVQQLQANEAKQKEIEELGQQLRKLREQGQQEAEQLSQQRAALQQHYVQQNELARAKHAAQQAELLDKSAQQVQDLRLKTALAQEQLAKEADQELWLEQNRDQQRLAQQYLEHGIQQKALAEEKEQALRRESDLYQQQLKTLQRDHFAQLERIRQLNEEQNRSYQQNFELTSNQQKQYYQAQRLKEDAALQKNYTLHQQQLANTLAEVQRQMEQDILAAQQAAAYTKQAVNDKLADQFYRFEQLPATFTEDAQGATVTMRVPPYEKNNVLLHVHGHKLRLSFSRRTEEKLPQAAGMGRYARSESLAQEFTATQVLDPQTITQSYHDGLLTFKVAKA